MMGLDCDSIMLNMVNDYASLSTEKRWLISAFGGMIMCKLSYEFTGIVTPFIFNGFTKLNKEQKLEWKNRGFSTFHALFVAIASVYFILFSDIFDEDAHEELIIKRRSTLSETILGMSSGYFLSDMAMIVWTYPTLGGFEYVKILNSYRYEPKSGRVG
nr:transmembrane protein 56-B-like [Tanacetum cinerariifolium]GEZ86304.1 transmembrane protein 56-B-like [Tanacetum cinerariifolium]